MAAFGCALSHDIGRRSGAQKQQGVIREVMSRKKRGAIAGGRQVGTALSGRQGIAAPAKGGQFRKDWCRMRRKAPERLVFRGSLNPLYTLRAVLRRKTSGIAAAGAVKCGNADPLAFAAIST